MFDAEENDDKDGVQHYLRALRKKVEHQVKNPFDLTFANFTFEELATWKNNVLQLDATSRLYGQRVDFLHCGALQILGSVLNNEAAVQSSAEKRQEIRKEDAYDNTPYERNLEQPSKLNSPIERHEANFMLWREVCKKRDALHQLMLNELSIDKDVRLALVPPDALTAVYEQLITEEHVVYLKLLDFRNLSTKYLGIFGEIEEAASEANLFMVNFSGNSKARGENLNVQSWMDFDFQVQLPEQMFQDIQPDVNNPKCELSSMQIEPQEEELQEEEEDDEEFSDLDDTQDFFQMDNWSRNGKAAKTKSKPNKKKQRERREKPEEMVDFKGMPLERTHILMPEVDQCEERFISNRDHLLLRFVKYNNPYAKKLKKNVVASKFKPLPQNPYLDRGESVFEPLTCQNQQNQSFSWNPATNLSRFSQQQRFKQAALPIKEMKRRIKERVDINEERKLYFQQIKRTFSKEEPIDIFISVLHIAAEEQATIII